MTLVLLGYADQPEVVRRRMVSGRQYDFDVRRVCGGRRLDNPPPGAKGCFAAARSRSPRNI